MRNMQQKTYSIGEAARICGVTEKQIRHWEVKNHIEISITIYIFNGIMSGCGLTWPETTGFPSNFSRIEITVCQNGYRNDPLTARVN